MRGDRVMLWLERLLILVGVTCLSCFALVTASAAFYQRQRAAAFDQMRAVQSLPPAPKQIVTTEPESDDSLIGMLDIPRLSLSTPIVSGDDRATLEIAAGHLPDTPRPWEDGNSAIAAHRDGLFRPLKGIRIGDQVVVRTLRGDLEYRVRNTKIVSPTDLSVIAPTATQSLTLITCYPFGYIGNAPKRFIVHADRVTTDTAPVLVAASSTSAVAETTADRGAVAGGWSGSELKPAKPQAKPSKSKQKARAVKARALSRAVPVKTTTEIGSADSATKRAGKPSKARNFFRKVGGFFKGKR